MSEPDGVEARPSHFIRDMIVADLEGGLHGRQLQTRFPPEPNGFLTLGHAKAICLNFGLAIEFGGRCNLRFDDTNPEKESEEYVNAIREDIRWLGFGWDRETYASDYFQQLFEWALQLIDRGLAYVDELSADEMRAYRGTTTEPGRPSPWRDRPAAESRERFLQMRDGEVDEGSMVLRAKIDMAHPNLNMRDPAMYRIRKVSHHRVGAAWCIYPTYDYTHGQSDSIERVTHSLCSLEFEDHRPLYDWFIAQLGIFPSRQTEFARLNLTYTVMSKRYLRRLVEDGVVDGWDDPRMPTLSGLRRRGVPPEAIRRFMETVGITKFNAWTDVALLEHAVRDVLNRTATRRMVVLDPLKITLTNLLPEDAFDADLANNPEDDEAGTRRVPFCDELWIERADFLEDAPKKFFRLKPGGEVRLRGSFVIRCDEVIRDAVGEVVELRCSADRETLGRNPEGRKVKGVIHWVSARHAREIEVRLYDRLFRVERPGTGEFDFMDELNPGSARTLSALAEPAILDIRPGDPCQFERVGYFTPDLVSTPEKPLFNQTVSLKK